MHAVPPHTGAYAFCRVQSFLALQVAFSLNFLYLRTYIRLDGRFLALCCTFCHGIRLSQPTCKAIRCLLVLGQTELKVSFILVSRLLISYLFPSFQKSSQPVLPLLKLPACKGSMLC